MPAVADLKPQKGSAAAARQLRPAEFGSDGGVAAVVLLAGAVRRSRLHMAIDRSPLDLPVAGEATLLQLWRDQVDQLADTLGAGRLRGRLVVDGEFTAPAEIPQGRQSAWSVETDPAELRGTGGLLRDLAAGYGEGEYLVVATAAHLPLHPIDRFVADAVRDQADVAVLEDLTGSPTSVFVIACRALRGLPAVGFIDLKEQALPQIAAKHRVRVISVPGPLAVPVRTAANYLSAVQAHSRRLTGLGDTETAFAERWRSDFAIVEPGAQVGDGAKLHNAVVLKGAIVEAGSTVANSLVCPGGRVSRGRQILNQLVTADGCFSISEQ